jgi:glucosamine kinase
VKRGPQIANVVGVDAGGTKTSAAFARDGALERRAERGAANATVRGVDDAAEEILRAIADVCGEVQPDAIYIGAAGAGSHEVARDLGKRIARVYGKAAIRVGDDVEIALRAAIPSGPGIVVISGTGSIALAYDKDGKRHRAGGYGYLLGDEGSAAWIGLEALRLLGRAYDGRVRAEETTAIVERHLGVSDRSGLLRAVYGKGFDVTDIAALAPSIVAFAGKGNRASRAIVGRAAAELSLLAVDVARAANLLESGPNIALAGGLLREENFLQSSMIELITAAIVGAKFATVVDPLEGAIRCAQALLV